ncbi:MAG: hypothetical protein DMG78_25525 [Acidobacteria bacterium]|nr:MAG: hypothetical protein DMG78_25525 [Acidobacteriota bacterium]
MAYSIAEWIMVLVPSILYFALLIFVASFAILWSNWPEKQGGWLLATKQKMPPIVQLWHPKHVFPIYILCGVLLLLFTYLEYKALEGLGTP